MLKYIAHRLLMMIPTFFGITLMCFMVINLAPGGPIDQQIRAFKMGAQAGGGEVGNASGDVGISNEVLEALKKQYGFDKPVHIRYALWLKNIFTLEFGESFTYYRPAIDVIVSKFPVSIQFGLASIILTYMVCIPLGIMKAVKDGTTFDMVSSVVLFIMYSIPSVMLAILLIVFFAGGSYFDWFPMQGLYSDGYESFNFFEKIGDRLHHFVLPLICYMIGSFTVLTFLMKNSLMDEIKLDYIRTARAKGLDERTVYYKHALRNALIPVVTGVGGAIGFFLSGSLIIETIFGLDGIGLLMFDSMLSRDYNVIMALIFLSTVISLLARLISDILYVVVDPRIDFGS